MRFLAFFLLSTYSLYSLADEPPKIWQGMLDMGYLSSMGSTSGSKETFRGKTSLTHNGDYWIQIFSAEGLSVRDEVPTTNDSERYLAAYKARHFFAERNFFTLRLQWEKDMLSASEYQAFGSLGLGRELVKTEAHFLKIETGPGIRHSELRFAPPKDEAIALFSWDYDWKINPHTKFIHKGTVEAGEYNTITRVNNQLKQNITKVIALSINHDYKHDDGEKNTREGVFSIGLNYQF
ncbi:DUF481 domain-containing protein [Agitococcus lubricus]|uniref:Putative salt-induced outer membrane protein YdiY n=1 Tax=Agitococcus lubricus TaxID=1077255 RepID=A0A2T5IVK2_9GAMM|nr:DUF481 domain-containing protein [Agitococcus lubricus]PTQ87898.1 putative salt-induced outer membrane protein YdiY [Agitococcus lubricus]